MSGLSPEALGQLEGLNLQEARRDFNFVSAVGTRESLNANLSADELNEFRNWDFSGVLAGLNSLTFEAMHPELVATPAETVAPVPAAEEDLPDWLKSVRTEIPVAETDSPAPLPEGPVLDGPTAEEVMAGLRTADVEARLAAAVTPEDHEVDENAEASPDEKAEESVEPESGAVSERKTTIDGMKEAFRSYLSTWLDRNKLSLAAEFTGGTAAGFLTNLCFTELIAKNPQMASFLPSVLTSLQGSMLIATNLMEAGTISLLNLRGKSGLAEKAIRASSLAESIAVAHAADNSIDRFLLTGLTVPKKMRDIAIRPGTTGFTAGAWLYAGLSAAGVFGSDQMFINGAHAAQPAASGGEGFNNPHPGHRPVVEASGQIGGLPPDVQPPADVATANEATQAAQAAAQQAEAAAQVAAQAAEAARIAALQQGPTVAELAAQMPKQTVSEAIYQMIGNVPHRGEVTNVLFRAIGDKVNSLNEGAIKAASEALRPVFENIDKVMADSGTAYTEGGRAVVEAMSGFNSPEAQAIRAANMGDLEAAGNLLNNVIGPVIR